MIIKFNFVENYEYNDYFVNIADSLCPHNETAMGERTHNL